MHHNLPELVSNLLVSADKVKQRDSFKNTMLELAKVAQTLAEHHLLVRMVARSMSGAVETAFGPLSLIFLLTEPGRRQVYLAVLARLADERFPEADDTRNNWRQALLERLLLESDEDLITGAYGRCPPGFVRVLRRLGQLARGAHIYTGLFGLLSSSPRLGYSLQSADQAALTDEFIELLIAIPVGPHAISLAKCFEWPHDYRRFMSTYSVLTGEGTLREDHALRLCSGEAPSSVLRSIYLGIYFGAPAIAMPGIHYISNGAELVEVSTEFKNCLRNYVAESIRGERQHYIWQKQGQPAVVFCISADKPFGWHLTECKLAGNETVPEPMLCELKSLLEFSGVRTGGSGEEMMGFFVSHRFDAELEELLQEMAA